jgi:hypothetical protein
MITPWNAQVRCKTVYPQATGPIMANVSMNVGNMGDWIGVENANGLTMTTGTGMVELDQAMINGKTTKFRASSIDGHVEIWMSQPTSAAMVAQVDLFRGASK